MIQILICEDHDMVRTGLVRALQADRLFQVVGEASSAEQLLRQLRDGTPAELLLLDLNLGHSGLSAGIDLIAQVVALHPALHILVVSMHDEPEVVKRALEAGAKGYVTKDSAISVLVEAIFHLHQGRRFLDPALVEALVVKSRKSSSEPFDAGLTKREREVMRMLVNGQRVSDIALEMGLSVKTVSTHKIRLMEKLNVSNNADLIKLGIRHHLVAN
jgi:DNA-binding NarL/FixJ family response regulator